MLRKISGYIFTLLISLVVLPLSAERKKEVVPKAPLFCGAAVQPLRFQTPLVFFSDPTSGSLFLFDP